MIITTKNSVLLRPFVSVTSSPVDVGGVTGSVVTGSFTSYSDRTQATFSYTYSVSTNADTVTNLNPEVLDLSGFPDVVGVESPSGTIGTVRFSLNGVSTTRVFDIGTQGSPQTFRVCEGVVAGTLLAHCHNLIFPAASAVGKTDYYYETSSGTPVSLLSGTAYLTAKRNSDCWAAQWDFSGVPVWNSSGAAPGVGGAQHGGALITTRHLVEANHFASPVGAVFKFMTADGAIISRTSIGVSQPAVGSTTYETNHLAAVSGDIRVHVLDSALPESIAVYPIVGDWSMSNFVAGAASSSTPYQLNGAYYRSPVVGVWLAQTRKAKFIGSYGADCLTYDTGLTTTTFAGVSVTLPATSFSFSMVFSGSDFVTSLTSTGRHANGVSGDSGSPIFLPRNGSNLVLCTCWTSPASGPRYTAARLNALIASADTNAGIPTGLTVTVAPDPTL